MKFFEYDLYKKIKTEGYEYLTDFNDFGIYVKPDTVWSDYSDYQIIYHENVTDWEDGHTLSALLTNKDGINKLKRALKDYKSGTKGRLYNEIVPDNDEYVTVQEWLQNNYSDDYGVVVKR